MPPAKSTSGFRPVNAKPSGRNMHAQDSDVEEYVFSSDGNEDVDMDDDVQSHISVSSDDPPPSQDPYSIDPRPWLLMNAEQRHIYEQMFVNITTPAIGQSWSYTEQYQASIDALLLRYMEDFPLPTWQIGREAAEKAYNSFRERARWRVLGIKIYGSEQMPNLYQHRQLQQQQQAAQPQQMPQAAPMPVQAPAMPKVDAPSKSRTSSQSAAPPPKRYKSAPKETQMTDTTAKIAFAEPPIRLSTPPYPERRRPSQVSGVTSSTIKVHIFPWNRGMDYRKAVKAAKWDDSIYDRQTLKAMDAVRRHNATVMTQLGQGHLQAQIPTQQAAQINTGAKPAAKTSRKRKKDDDNVMHNPYHPGHYAFCTAEDHQLAAELGGHDITGFIQMGMDNEVTAEELHAVKLCWRAGAEVTNLRQAPLSVRDMVRTRKQTDQSPILTKRAAERIIDFTPDRLHKDLLLRICSEGGMDATAICERLCLNGNLTYVAKINQGIATALARPHFPAKKGASAAAEDLHKSYVEDFDTYTAFFTTQSRRSSTGGGRGKRKRKEESPELEQVSGYAEVEQEVIRSEDENDVKTTDMGPPWV